MTRLDRWFILNVALGAFPLGVRLLLRIANRATLEDVVVDSSDVIVLALTVSITTLADLLRATDLRRLAGTNLHEWGVYSVGAATVSPLYGMAYRRRACSGTGMDLRSEIIHG